MLKKKKGENLFDTPEITSRLIKGLNLNVKKRQIKREKKAKEQVRKRVRRRTVNRCYAINMVYADAQ